MSKKSNDASRSDRAKAIRDAQARKDRNRNVVIGVGVVVALGAIMALVYFGTRPASLEEQAADLPTVSVVDEVLVMGDQDAPVTVAVYEDFLCPYCRQFEESSKETLRTAVEAGKIKVEYRPYSLLSSFEYSKDALNAYRSVLLNGTPEQALLFHDKLFEEQPYEQANDHPSRKDLAKLAAEVSAGSDEIKDGILEHDTAWIEKVAKDSEVTENEQGQKGTPAVTINGKLIEGGIQEYLTAINAAISSADK